MDQSQGTMKVHTLGTKERAAQAAAEFIASEARNAVAHKGSFSLAVSGGSTPELMLEHLGEQKVDWPRVHLFQVDERIAPTGDPSRNALQLKRALVDRIALPKENVHLMPVEQGDLSAASRAYEGELRRLLGPAPTLDLIHLGLGSDGHTASLVPGDRLISEEGLVGISQEYHGQKRMSLLRAPINRARKRVWLVTGDDKRNAIARLLSGDRTIPAGTISARDSTLFTDQAQAPS